MKNEGKCENILPPLNGKINLKDLIGNECQFTLDNANEDADNDTINAVDPEKIFEFSELAPYCLLEALEMDGYDSECIPFKTLKEKMTDLRADGKLAKQILKPGTGDQMQDGFTVSYHYAFYLDGNEYPFDISYLRRKPMTYTLGENTILPGIYEALCSMKSGELSFFYIDYTLAFGEHGSPPTIPPRQPILARIQLLDYVTELVKNEDKEPGSFEEILKKANEQHLNGNKYFEKNQKKSAVNCYQYSTSLLLDAMLINPEGEALMKKQLIKLYHNLALCFNDLKLYKKTCDIGNDAFRFCPNEAEKDVKLLYQFGKALRILCDYDEAKKKLKQALQIDNKNSKIIDELRMLSTGIESEKELCSKMCRFVDINGKQNGEEKEKNSDAEINMDEITKTWKKFLEKFVEDINKPLVRISKCSPKDISVIRKLCEKMNLNYREIKGDLLMSIEVTKRK